ncbi:cytochrome c oxidase subunit IVB [Peribacillus cavernae]|uniref:Cytochrome c oxidase subunit IVB n=1 Tax=Peribacillus cavernae TaxID=1674310 RepID=A0A433HPV1_9BACI|nr:cytochrome c oxidase subunit IVB [Peribacillus cavernae]MDQ0217206.1 cytochrome c oxidase subunit 4 [Peribacillus cavernae]RUQ30323.1 cytochrome c oxidase subunit IVB [Peribacillus cavernae]
MANNQSNSANPNVDLKYRRKKNAEEMKHQVVTFTMMIFFTLIAFLAVAYDGFSHWFIRPFILLLAVVQVAFQLYYFMHMKHKGHNTIALFLFSGLAVGLATVLVFMTIVWL